MNSISQKLRRIALAALAATAFLSQAHAAPVVSISPATQTIGVGGTATVDIIVSGLTQPADAVGGFSLTLDFNDTFLSGISFLNDPDGLMGLVPLDLSCGFSGGPITVPCTVGLTGISPLDLFFVADFAATEATLAAAQGTGFTLARVRFLGLADGISPLTLKNVVLSEWDGLTRIGGVTPRNGDICVGPNCAGTPIPEPASMLLVAAAFGALALSRKRKQA